MQRSLEMGEMTPEVAGQFPDPKASPIGAFGGRRFPGDGPIFMGGSGDRSKLRGDDDGVTDEHGYLRVSTSEARDAARRDLEEAANRQFETLTSGASPDSITDPLAPNDKKDGERWSTQNGSYCTIWEAYKASDGKLHIRVVNRADANL